jgi:hypothetical protein
MTTGRLQIQSFIASIAASLLLLMAAGCGRHSHSDHDHDHGAGAHHHHHEHVAPHGGTVVVLGDEAFHIEFVHDPSGAAMSAYLLDGHMENFTRIAQPSFEVIARSEGQARTLVFRAVAEAATGETVGDTAHFRATDPWLAGDVAFDGVIPAINVRGATFGDVTFTFPGGPEGHRH